jgi:hypothetical protein
VLSGTLPPGTHSKILAVRLPPRPESMHFEFFAPPVNAGVNYALTYCIGARSNPCGLPSDITIDVIKGQTQARTYSSTVFRNRIFVVGQGTRRSVPYRVVITP